MYRCTHRPNCPSRNLDKVPRLVVFCPHVQIISPVPDKSAQHPPSGGGPQHQARDALPFGVPLRLPWSDCQQQIPYQAPDVDDSEDDQGCHGSITPKTCQTREPPPVMAVPM